METLLATDTRTPVFIPARLLTPGSLIRLAGRPVVLRAVEPISDQHVMLIAGDLSTETVRAEANVLVFRSAA